MMDVMNNAASAIRAHTRGLLVSAHNTANVLTEDYHPLANIVTSAPGGGVTSHIETREDVEGVDLVEESLNSLASERAIEANLAVLKASEKTLGVLIDIVG